MEKLEGLRVLLVDDENLMQTLLTQQLKMLGVKTVYNCQRAGEALEILSSQAEDLDLIIFDLRMPDMDGIEFLRQLIAVNYQGGIALASEEDIRVLRSAENYAKANKLFILGALLKPIEIESLKKILLSAAEGKVFDYESDAEHFFTREEIEQAILEKELTNYYQPKIHLSTGDVVGLEILVRWDHPAHGLIRPEKFIPLVENEGLIDQLTYYVLEAALADLSEWAKQNNESHLALNVSTITICNLDFPDALSELLEKFSFPAGRLIVEVTESEMLRNPETVFDVLTRLRLKGITLSIDDFGTGYSSLAQLRDVPFSELKIDKGFINGAFEDHSLRAIVEGSLSIAQNIGLKSVAEGVETEADWKLITQTSCDTGQGYFIGRPMLAESLTAWADGWQQRFQELLPA